MNANSRIRFSLQIVFVCTLHHLIIIIVQTYLYRPEITRLSYISDVSYQYTTHSWWRLQMEDFSALLAICTGNSPVPGEFPAQRPLTRSFDVFFDLRPNTRLNKQSRGWWFETLSGLLWRHRNVKWIWAKAFIGFLLMTTFFSFTCQNLLTSIQFLFRQAEVVN